MDKKFMERAITLAKTAAAQGEVPVGAVVVRDGKIIGEGYNRCEELSSPTAHAEIMAINAAAKTQKDWRLGGCSLYVTLEPCPMCAGAILGARLDEVVFGAFDNRAGSCANESVVNLFSLGYENPPTVYGGIMEEECKTILREFFEKRR
ncbi:MAG: nucleoside deaminase [Clostridia bacterium]|nr:nucleoside deaminase [Clostridia bacterium]MBQ2274299.1 nucleoside deaminase [Clostridia bacterium]MBQ5798881.1 nucleoside deaminase [Clostridia bacterium]MEE1278561.1 nucleoside deaminase [Acutalibacteraceae bacterium]